MERFFRKAMFPDMAMEEGMMLAFPCRILLAEDVFLMRRGQGFVHACAGRETVFACGMRLFFGFCR